LQGSKRKPPFPVAVDDELDGPVAQVAHPVEEHDAFGSFHSRKDCAKGRKKGGPEWTETGGKETGGGNAWFFKPQTARRTQRKEAVWFTVPYGALRHCEESGLVFRVGMTKQSQPEMRIVAGTGCLVVFIACQACKENLSGIMNL
jgi:hypothetical protein